MANEHGAYHIADNPQLYEPARSNNFELVVTGIDTLLQAGVDENTATENDYIRNGQETIRVSVLSSSVPHFELGDIQVKRGNSTSHYAGVPTFNTTDLVVNDYIGARTKDVLMAWQGLAYDVRGEKIRSSANYKKDCTLYEYTPDYEKVIRYWEIKGAWVSNVTEDAFSNENNDKRQVTATIIYDRAIMHLPDDE